jgi:hypothetical protein
MYNGNLLRPSIPALLNVLLVCGASELIHVCTFIQDACKCREYCHGQFHLCNHLQGDDMVVDVCCSWPRVDVLMLHMMQQCSDGAFDACRWALATSTLSPRWCPTAPHPLWPCSTPLRPSSSIEQLCHPVKVYNSRCCRAARLHMAEPFLWVSACHHVGLAALEGAVS